MAPSTGWQTTADLCEELEALRDAPEHMLLAAIYLRAQKDAETNPAARHFVQTVRANCRREGAVNAMLRAMAEDRPVLVVRRPYRKAGDSPMSNFNWTGKREQAALLVAEGGLTNTEIAARIGASTRSLDRWRLQPEFRARVAEVVQELRQAVLDAGVRARSRRVATLDDLWRRLLAVIDARAREMEGVPGGDSGLLVQRARVVKVYGAEQDPQIGDVGEEITPMRRAVLVHDYAVDTGLLKQLMDLQRQAAEDLGEWGDRPEAGDKLVRVYIGVNPDDV